MPPVKIDHIGLNVRNLETSIAFYRELFGAELLAEWTQPRQAFMRANGGVLGLIEMPNYDY